jgi:hypothetical protein
MKVLLSWMRDFVDVTASADEIAKTMSVRGFAVEGLDVLRGGDAVSRFRGNRQSSPTALRDGDGARESRLPSTFPCAGPRFADPKRPRL